jgi:Ion channel
MVGLSSDLVIPNGMKCGDTMPHPMAHRGVLSHAKANTGPRLALVCSLVLLVMAMAMALPDGKLQGALTVVPMGLALMAAVWASRVTGRFLRITIATVGVVVLASVVALVLGGGPSITASAVVSTLFVVGMAIAIVVGLRDARSVNVQTVFGAVSLYLLIGLFYAFLITVIARVSDALYFAQGTDGNLSVRVYFSYITLATLGYGDYTPATGLGRALAVFEAIIGSLFLVTVVGVSVSRLGRSPAQDAAARGTPEPPDGP